MKPSTLAARLSVAMAAALTAIVWYFLPFLPWWALLIVFLVLVGSLNSGLLEDLANKRIADGE